MKKSLLSSLETAVLSEADFNKYCRVKGLYTEQVKQWKQACIAGNTVKDKRNTKITTEQQSDKKRLKELEREHRHSRIRFVTPNQRHA